MTCVTSWKKVHYSWNDFFHENYHLRNIQVEELLKGLEERDRRIQQLENEVNTHVTI